METRSQGLKVTNVFKVFSDLNYLRAAGFALTVTKTVPQPYNAPVPRKVYICPPAALPRFVQVADIL